MSKSKARYILGQVVLMLFVFSWVPLGYLISEGELWGLGLMLGMYVAALILSVCYWALFGEG